MMAILDVAILAVRLFTVGFNVFARWRQHLWFKGDEFEGILSVYGLKVVKSCFWGHFLYSLVLTLLQICYRMYHLVTMHSVTDRRTDRRHYHANSRSHYVQYDHLISKKAGENKGELRDAAVNFDAYRILQRHRTCRFPSTARLSCWSLSTDYSESSFCQKVVSTRKNH